MYCAHWTRCLLLLVLQCSGLSMIKSHPLASNLHTALLPVKQIHKFAPGTWIENLAVRKNGEILVTEITHPRVYLIDPLRAPEPLLIHEFNDTASVLGIVEAEEDVFYVCTANYSAITLQAYGEAYVYRIDMRSFSRERRFSARVDRLATVSGGAALDGLTYFAGLEDGVLFVSDLLRGVIWGITVSDGQLHVAANSTYTRSEGFQVNGLKTFRNELFFAVTGSKLWAKVSLDARGTIGEEYTILSQRAFEPDDFALDLQGGGYIASLAFGNNGIVYVPPGGGDGRLIASLVGPSACAFGRTADDCHVLYVTTTGGDEDYASNGTFLGAGTLSALDLGPEAAFECKRNLHQASMLGWIGGL